MDPAVSEHLERARAARRADDGLAALAALRHAAARALETGDPASIQLAGWRRAKGEFDFGTPETLLASLEPIVALPTPFEHYPQGLHAAEPIARRIWDHLGYRSDAVLQLWSAWGAHHRSTGDTYLAAQADLQRAWHMACRGDTDAVQNIAEPWFRLTPARFGRGPTKHPDAEDATLSLYWIQVDLGRTLLRAATWTGRERLARDARDHLEDALAWSSRSLGKAPWCVDAICRAADRFAWSDAPWPAWSKVLSGWSQAHPVHARLGGAVFDRRDGRSDRAIAGFEATAELAERKRAGFEWVADSLIEAQRTSPAPERARRIEELCRTTGLGLAVG